MGRARTTNLLYFLKCNNLVFLKTQRAAHSLFPEKVLVLEAAAPCRTAGPLARGAGGRGMRGPSRKCQVGESQFLANYLGNLQFRFLSVTTRCAARRWHCWAGRRGQSRGTARGAPWPRARSLWTFHFSVQGFGPRPKATAMLLMAKSCCCCCFFAFPNGNLLTFVLENFCN